MEQRGVEKKNMSLQRFSSSDIPERERIAFFRDVYSVVEQVDIEPANDAPLVVDAAVRKLDEVTVVSASCSPCVSRRTDRHLVDGKDDLVLCVVMSGAIVRSRNGGAPTLLTAGDAYLGTSGISTEHRFGTTSTFLDIAIPRARLQLLLRNPARVLAMDKLPPCPELSLLTHYARTLVADEFEALRPATTTSCARHIVDLVAVAAGASRDAEEHVSRGSLRQVRWSALKSDIEANLARPELSLEWLARRHGISPRYVRDLFASAGTSFTEFVLNARLDHARRLLCSATRAHRGISGIAFESGFSDLSYFNRTFRRRFGVTPSEMRHSAACGEHVSSS